MDDAVVVAVAVADAAVEIVVVLIVSIQKRVGGDRMDMKTEVRDHVVVVIVVAVAHAVVVAGAENAGDVEDVEPTEDDVVAAQDRTVVDRLVPKSVVRSADVADHGRQQPWMASIETFPNWPDLLIQVFPLGKHWDHRFLWIGEGQVAFGALASASFLDENDCNLDK